jgi:hypothetical protein
LKISLLLNNNCELTSIAVNKICLQISTP